MKEIENYEDVSLLVKSFYAKVVENEILAPHFVGLDWEAHFPRMIDFCSFILINKEGYKGNVFDKHVHLNICEPEFDEWLRLCTGTVDEHFIGEKADLAKQRASLLKYTFMNKLKELKEKKQD